MNRILFWTMVVASCVLFPCQALAQARAGTATIHLKIVAAEIDLDLGEAWVTRFQSEETGEDYAKQFRNNRASGIPYGTYQIKLHQDGFYSAVRRIVVYQPEVWVVMGLEVGMEGGPRVHTIIADIRPLPSATEEVWVRLVGVFTDTIIDSKVRSSGTVLLAHVPVGHHVLIIRVGTRILATKPVTVPQRDPLIVELPELSRSTTPPPPSWFPLFP